MRRQNITHRDGLTLIELILALLIVEVALLIMVQTFVQGLHLQQRVADQSRAILVAQAQMDAVLRYASSRGASLPETGKFPAESRPVDADALGLHESAVEGYRWQADVSPHGEGSRLREITLRLTWMARGRDREISLVSLAALAQ